jgi:putative mycofactocin binding protein MftB
LNKVYRLAKGVQVRKESWGLLFYSQINHKICFIKSRDLLHPEYFDGSWACERLICDIADRSNTSVESINSSIQTAMEHLIKKEMIVNELC